MDVLSTPLAERSVGLQPRAETDESARSSLYRTESRPFPRPSSGQTDVTVINHHGDEVLKVIGT